MRHAIKPNQEKEKPSEDGVYNGPTRKRTINLSQDGKTQKYIHIGKNIIEEECEKLKQILVKYWYCFSWSYEDLKGIDEAIVICIIPLRANAILGT